MAQKMWFYSLNLEFMQKNVMDCEYRNKRVEKNMQFNSTTIPANEWL